MLLRLLASLGRRGDPAAAQEQDRVEIVSATRLSESEFWESAPLGRSLRRLTHEGRLVPRIAFGNRRRVRNQPAWPWIDDEFTADDRRNLSGRVAHGADPFGTVSFFGAAPARCELLDGVLLAARKSRLVRRGVRFDPRFRFHFYDMDFCRQAEAKGLTLGTCPISVVHESGGAFGRTDSFFGNWPRPSASVRARAWSATLRASAVLFSESRKRT